MQTIKLILVVSGIIFCNYLAYSQNFISIDDCYKSAKEKCKISENSNLYDNISALNIKNYSKAYYPQLSTNATASYQSDITKLDIQFDEFFGSLFSQLPNGQNIQIPTLDMPEPKKDQYKLSLDLNQVIYDGGVIKASKNLEKASNEALKQNIEIELYSLNEKINKTYFAILLLNESKSLLQMLIKQLDDRIKVLESGLQNGVINSSVINQLKAEKLKSSQQLIELEYNKKTFTEALTILTGNQISENDSLLVPEVKTEFFTTINRPELKLIDQNITKLDFTSLLISRKKYPKFFGFGQAGYGRPGLNMLSAQFSTFWLVGLKLTWNVWDWNQTKNERQIIDIQKNILSNQKQYFSDNLSLINNSELLNIEKLKKLIEIDTEIIEIKSDILKTSASKLENGIITATEYLEDLNSETQAKINLETHKLQLIQSKVNNKNITGN